MKEAQLGCALHDVEVETVSLDITEIQSHDPLEVAHHKAQSAFAQLQRPVVVNDTSWHIPALNGFPGAYMKDVANWFSSEDFLNLMRDKDDRRVMFTESITYVDASQTKTFCQEYWGTFTTEPRGIGVSIEQVAEFNGCTLGEKREQGGVSHKPEEYIWAEFAKWYSEQ